MPTSAPARRRQRHLWLPALACFAAGLGITRWWLAPPATGSPATGLVSVQSPRDGLASEIRAREGERVDLGAPLLLFDASAAASRSRQLQALLEQASRLRAEIALLPNLHSDRIGLLQSRLALARRGDAQDELAAWEAELAELQDHALERERALHQAYTTLLAAIDAEAERVGLVIHSPASGTVIRMHAQRGQQLREGQRIADLLVDPPIAAGSP